MGQQQLLLVILVTILAGVATAVAINTFSSAAENAARDALHQDMASIAAAAQSYYIKPKLMGGGSNSFNGINFNNLPLSTDSLADAGLTAFNTNGRYTLSVEAGGSRLSITADGAVAAAGCVESGSFKKSACEDSGETSGIASAESVPDDNSAQSEKEHSDRNKGWWRFFFR